MKLSEMMPEIMDYMVSMVECGRTIDSVIQDAQELYGLSDITANNIAMLCL